MQLYPRGLSPPNWLIGCCTPKRNKLISSRVGAKSWPIETTLLGGFPLKGLNWQPQSRPWGLEEVTWEDSKQKQLKEAEIGSLRVRDMNFGGHSWNGKAIISAPILPMMSMRE